MNCDNLNKLNLLKTTKTIKMDDVWRRHWLLGVSGRDLRNASYYVILFLLFEIKFWYEAV